MGLRVRGLGFGPSGASCKRAMRDLQRYQKAFMGVLGGTLMGPTSSAKSSPLYEAMREPFLGTFVLHI